MKNGQKMNLEVRAAEFQYDVIVVGSGPVGMVAAGLMARRGLRVCVLERHSSLYGLPRAANFDGETMRTFDRLDIADDLLPLLQFEPNYLWQNARGELLLEIRFSEHGVAGWADFYQMYQPDVEQALFTAASGFGTDFRFDCTVLGYTQHVDHVDVETSTGAITAAYVIACDGGSGMTREAIGSTITDFDFSVPWLVCDFEYSGEDRVVPRALQLSDPAQPVSIIALGRRHQRFSYMLDPDADLAREKAPEAVWRRVSDYLQPDEADLIRTADYVFRSQLADSWRDRRIFVAGDAAHQMPPFLGQGMVSGIRDAQNLAFKLDLVLSGRANDSILNSYQSERLPHVKAILQRAVELGRIQTTRDPLAAAARDARLLAQRRLSAEPQRPLLPPLGDGLFTEREDLTKGNLLPQGRLSDGTTTKLLDHWTDGGADFVLLTGDDSASPAPGTVVRTVRLGAHGLEDVDHTYSSWFAENAASAVLVRPDGYIFGSASDVDEVASLLADLHRRLDDSSTPVEGVR